MGSSYDAQRNEFCAYVLNESETPYGLLLGNYKTYAQSTAKGGVRGLWDADTDQIIFGTHQIAYRLSDAARSSRIRSSASSPFSRTRRSPSSRSTIASTSPKRFTFRTARRSIAPSPSSWTSRSTIRAPRRWRSRSFPWAMLVGQRFYGEPEHEVRAWNDGRFICSRNLETGGERWWGGSRPPVAVELSLREQVLLEVDAPRDAGQAANPRRPWTT